MLAQLASLHETTPQAAHPHSALSLISKPIRLLSYSIALQHTNSIYNSQIIQRKDMACEKILPINNEKTGQKKNLNIGQLNDTKTLNIGQLNTYSGHV
jgi:hypothetical protein